MSSVVVVGATGYAGGHLVDELLARGHEVTAVARTISDTHDQTKLAARPGSLTDPDLLAKVGASADVVVLATHALLDGDVSVADLLPSVLEAIGTGTRLGVVGGAGSLIVDDAGTRYVDSAEFPDFAKPEALAQAALLEALRASDTEVDWFYVSPSRGFGAHMPGERVGAYRTGSDQILRDRDEQPAAISGSDFATAFVDEIEKPQHHRTRFTVGY